MNCVFYDRTLQKKVPCIIIPGDVKTIIKTIRNVYVHVYFDQSKYIEYGVTQSELNRYSSEFVNFYELYPANDQTQIDYLNSVIPTGPVNNKLELDRFQSLISMITNTDSISKDIFYTLADLISYEILFMYCTQAELQFMAGIATYELQAVPNVIPVPQMIYMIKYIFDKYLPEDVIYDLINYNDYYNFRNILPISLNIAYMKTNVTLLTS